MKKNKKSLEERNNWENIATEFKEKYIQCLEIIASNKYTGFQPHNYASTKKKSKYSSSPSKLAKSKRNLKRTIANSPPTLKNSDGKKIKATSESVSMLFKKVMRTKGEHKIIQDLEELARGLCKLLEIPIVEIVFIDDNVCNLLRLTEEQ